MPTGIEWAEEVWNPATGCTKISAGCQNCYAERMCKRLKGMGQAKYLNGFDVQIHPEELKRTWGKKPKRIFVCSMGDLFHKKVHYEFISRVFHVMRSCPEHTFQVLTKRPERMWEFFRTSEMGAWPKNVWAGISIENENSAWLRLPDLLCLSVDIRFISFEPLLGPIPEIDLSGIDWVIVGGESGPGARPMHPDWARGIRPIEQWQSYDGSVYGWRNATAQTIDIKHNDKEESFFRVGKKAAGRILDGRTWKEMKMGNKICVCPKCDRQNQPELFS